MKKWYPCELHCHSLHSDGSFTVQKLTQTAKSRKLAGICLTDHNTVSGWEETDVQKEVTVLKGIEYTSYHGHMLCLGAEKIIDCFNISNIDLTMRELRESGGLVGIAHPFQLGTPICTGGHWDYDVKDFSLVNYMEIWSEGEMLMTTTNKKAKNMWLSLLDKGYRITPTFGRDWHRAENNKLKGACTCLLIDGEITADKMKEAIGKGRTQLSLGIIMTAETDGETVGDKIKPGKRTFNITLDTSRADLFKDEYTLSAETLKIITKGNITVYDGRAEESQVTLELKENSYYIFELWGNINGKENHLISLTAPIYT